MTPTPLCWVRAGGYLQSLGGRFRIEQLFEGTCSVQSYLVWDSKRGDKFTGDRLRDVKRDCAKRVQEEMRAELAARKSGGAA